MTKRRSPSRHIVGSYKRKNGTQVAEYPRGSGAQRSRARRVVGKPKGEAEDGVHGYVVNLKYSNKKDDGESIFVIDDQTGETALEDYKQVIDEAFEEKVDPRTPISVEVDDPDVGKMIKFLGRKVEGTIKWGAPKAIKATKLGAKFAVRATMVSAKTMANLAKAGVETAIYMGNVKIAESMLVPCWQKDRAKQTAARQALKLRFPSLYDMAGFSRERTRRRRKPPQVLRFPQRYRYVDGG